MAMSEHEYRRVVEELKGTGAHKPYDQDAWIRRHVAELERLGAQAVANAQAAHEAAIATRRTSITHVVLTTVAIRAFRAGLADRTETFVPRVKALPDAAFTKEFYATVSGIDDSMASGTDVARWLDLLDFTIRRAEASA